MATSDLSVRAAEVRSRFMNSASNPSPKVDSKPAKVTPAKKNPRSSRNFSFFSASTALDVHNNLRGLRNEGYRHGAIAIGMLPLIGASFYYSQYIVMVLPFSMIYGWHWALHKDRLKKFKSRSVRPALTPDMMLLYDNSEPIPFEGLHKKLDPPTPLKSVFKF